VGQIDPVSKLEAHSRITDVPRAAWDALVGDGSPFVEWDWLAALEESGAVAARTGWQPCHLTLWDGSTLVGACPLYVKSHSMGEFVFDQNWAGAAARAGIRYYPKLLAAVPFTPVTGVRFLTLASAKRAPLVARLAAGLEALCEQEDLSSVHVNFCLPDEVDVLAERGWLRRTGWQYHWRNAGFATFDDYLASLRSKRRNQVQRERRAPAEEGIEIAVHAGDDISKSLMERMFTLYRTTIGRLTWGQRYLNLAFFRLAQERLRERLCLVVARRDGQPIAGTLNVVKGDAFYGRYWGTTVDVRYLHFNVCYYAAIEYCVRHGLARFEPGAGGDFKLLRGFDATATDSMHLIRDPRLADAVRRYLRDERRTVESEIEWLGEKTARKRGAPGG
jgi:predicted N-acyltransferase